MNDSHPCLVQLKIARDGALAGVPGLHTEQPQNREGRDSRLVCHPLAILHCKVLFYLHRESMEMDINDTEYVPLVDTTRDELREHITHARNRFDRLIRTADPLARPPGMDWTVQQVAAHVLSVAHNYQRYAQGGHYRRAAYPRELRTINQSELGTVMAPVPELADQLQALSPEIDSFFDAVSNEGQTIPFHAGALIDGVTWQTNWLGELLFHGHDVARAVKVPWELPERDMLLIARGVMQFVPAFVRAGIPVDTNVRVVFQVPGARPYLMHIHHGSAEVRMRRPEDRPDAVLRAPASAITPLLYQRIRPLAAVRRGLRIVGGRRPWLALKLQSYIDPG
jgi:MDMPI C-terminal domain